MGGTILLIIGSWTSRSRPLLTGIEPSMNEPVSEENRIEPERPE
jgi:hypothetical protein